MQTFYGSALKRFNTIKEKEKRKIRLSRPRGSENKKPVVNGQFTTGSSIFSCKWCGAESNRRHKDFQSLKEWFHMAQYELTLLNGNIVDILSVSPATSSLRNQ